MQHWLGGVVAGTLLGVLPAAAQTPAPSATVSPSATPQLIQRADIVSAAESDFATITQFSLSLDSDSVLKSSRERLDRITAGIQARTAEANQLIGALSTGPALQKEEAGWVAWNTELEDLQRLLKAQADKLSATQLQVTALTSQWAATLAKTTDLPPEVAARIKDVQAKLKEVGKKIVQQEAAVLTLQNDTADATQTVTKMIAALEQARSAAMNRLVRQDSPALWKPESFSRTSEALDAAANSGWQAQLAEVGAYLQAQRGSVVLHLAIWIGLVALLRWARRKTRVWTEAEPALARSARIFEAPIALGSVVALSLPPLLYPVPPHLLMLLFGAARLVPLLLLLRRLVEPSLMPLTWALGIFYFAGQFREAAAGLPVVPRLILLGETIVAACFALYLVRIFWSDRDASGRSSFLRRTIRVSARVAVVAFALTTLANVLGYVNLAGFLTHAILAGAFVAVLLYVAIRIVVGLLIFALHVPPLSLLAVARGYRVLFERRCSIVLQIVAWLYWTWFALGQLTLAKPVWDGLAYLLDSLRFGPVSIGNLLEFTLTIWAAFLLSRFVRFILDEEVYRRVRLAPGMPFAVSTMLHYAILLVGFYLAAAILVGDMTKFTILAGAFSVGVGFGLQTVINNFVSGIIVLFERPIKIGDVIQATGGDVGTVRRIGIRATVIQTASGSEIIIPNGKLISDPVTNLTLSDRALSIDIPIATPSTVDPSVVLKLLAETASSHPKVSKYPAPRAELTKVGGGTFAFELHASTSEVEDWSAIRSELIVALHSALQAKNIAVS